MRMRAVAMCERANIVVHARVLTFAGSALSGLACELSIALDSAVAVFLIPMAFDPCSGFLLPFMSGARSVFTPVP